MVGNNCIRAGFLCEGYSPSSPWRKPAATLPTAHHQESSGQGGQGSDPQIDQQNAAEQHLEAERRAKPVAFGDDTSGVGSRTEVKSVQILSRDGSSQQQNEGPQVVSPARELPHEISANLGTPYSYNDRRPRSPRAQARMALSIEHQLSNRATTSEEIEKGKMEHGALYWPLDVHLVEERKRCKAALWRFNIACSPVSGLSTHEQNRLLREVFVPTSKTSIANGRRSPSSSPSQDSVGSIGPGAVIEAPFACNYGYYIHIGEEVFISENCLFVDDCGISIGAHSWIGPKVTILSSMAHVGMQECKGSQSRYQGRPVTIEEACFVGANSIIYPGVRLGCGAYIAPGEVVKSDVTVQGSQGLKPNYM